MSKKAVVSLIVGAAAGVVFFASGEAQASEVDGVWTPRTVDQIKADINKAKDNQYTIVWGDTLSGISQATNITVQKLADMNKIANVDLIYAGNTLIFDGNVVTAKNDKGETVAQTTVQPKDKNDANKPVGKQTEEKAPGKTASSQSQNKQGTTETSGKTATSSQGTSAAVSGTNGSQTGTSGSVEGTTSSTAGTTASSGVETPAQPSQPKESKPATPSKPAESKPAEQPSAPAEKPSTPTQPSTGGNQGGTTTPSETSKPEKDMTPINMGNSGKVFDSEEAASEYGYAEIANEKSPWFGYSFGSEQLVNKDYELTGKWTVSFLEEGYASGELTE